MKISIRWFILILVVCIITICINRVLVLRKAHSTFENYYAFRGCVQLVDRTDTYGHCKLASGQTIKLVKYQGKWFLDGDLPWGCIGKICFGF